MKKNKKWGGSFKYLIPVIIAVILLSGVLLSNKFITKQSLGSIYNVEEAEDNFYNIQIGDSINYEVNGYSDWQVIGKDDYNGTIDVVSKTNTEDITLEPNQTKEDYERIFQETANKYIDGSYAISARTTNQNDSNYFNYETDFWFNNIDNSYITTSKSTWQYAKSDAEPNYKMYVVPKIQVVGSRYNVGDTVEYSLNGVDKWIDVENIFRGKPSGWDPNIVLISKTPIELVIENIDTDINAKANQIIESFNADYVWGHGNYIDDNTINNLSNLIPDFLNQQTEKIWFYTSNSCYTKNGDKLLVGCCAPTYYYDNGEIGQAICGKDTIYESQNKSLGYRPVVTLKVKSEVQEKDKKEISNELQVGDNVRYEAKGYKNWKVLSIDKDNNLVDIISGGIVKNITLSGKDDWNNYEDIIQREVDEYKNDNRVINATTVISSHLKTLKKIDKSILSTYWILSKNSNIKYSHSLNDGKTDLIFYNIGTIKLYKNDNFEMYLNNITIYAVFIGDEEAVNHYKSKFYGTDINGIYITDLNSISYTAGLRPVITLKLDSVEKLPEEETKKIEDSTEKQEKVFIKEQESKNKDYKGPSKVDDSTSSTGNNNEVKTNDKDNTKKDNITDNNTSNVEKIVYKDKPFYKYGFIIFLMTSIIELIIIMLLLKKIKR